MAVATIVLFLMFTLSRLLSKKPAMSEVIASDEVASMLLARAEAAEKKAAALEKEVHRLRIASAAVPPLPPVPAPSTPRRHGRRVNKHEETEGAGQVGGAADAAAGANPAAPVVPVDTRPGVHATALLIICYNRPQYLRRTLESVIKYFPAASPPHVYISQDGEEPSVRTVIDEAKETFITKFHDVPFTHIKHKIDRSLDSKPMAGYYKLSDHFKWALSHLFDTQGHPRVIILEDDLEIAVDFFDYFAAMAPILDADRTLLAVSAWNDMGQAKFVEDPKQVYRSDFFPGLGWMLNARVWAELGPKWPEAFWDDWIRDNKQRQSRQFLRPEISRTYTFGSQGVSMSQYFDMYLANIKLNDEPVDWLNTDLSYLMDPAAYEANWAARIEAATLKSTVTDMVAASCPLGERQAMKVMYEDWPAYTRAAKEFGAIDDVRGNTPRTGFKGSILLRHNGCDKFIVPVPAYL